MRLLGRGAGDLVVAATRLAEPLDVPVHVERGAAALTGAVPMQGDLVATDEPAPPRSRQQVVEGRSAGGHALAGQRIARLRIEDEGDDPRVDVILAALAETA